MPVDFDNLFISLRANMRPAMAEVLAEQLGPAVTVEAIDKLGVGVLP